MFEFYQGKSNLFKLTVTLLIVAGFAGVCYWIAFTFFQCWGYGIGGFECDNGLPAFIALGVIGSPVLAVILLKNSGMPHPIIKGILLGVVPTILAVPGGLAWNTYTNNRNNTQALHELTNEVNQINFTVYLPTYLPEGFKLSSFDPSPFPSLSYDTNPSLASNVSISVYELKLNTNYNPPKNCYIEDKSAQMYGCSLLTETKVGEQIYIDSSRKMVGDSYFLAHGGTLVMIINDPYHPRPQTEIIKMFNSLSPQSKQQLDQLLND